MTTEPGEPLDNNAYIESLVGPLRYPSSRELLTDTRAIAHNMSEILERRFSELGAQPYEHTFHATIVDNGPLRVAITPSDILYYSGSPVWRVVVNRGDTIYEGDDAIPKELWLLSDFLIQPSEYRIGATHGYAKFSRGYSETYPPPGRPPRIIKNVRTEQYSLAPAEGYTHELPLIPLFIPVLNRQQRLKRYQAYVDAAWSIIHVLHYLNETTEVEGAPDLKHNEDE